MVVEVLYCEDATVHLELGISSRCKESWRIWTKTVSNLQQKWVWIITLSFKMIKIAYTKPWLKCHWKSAGWRSKEEWAWIAQEARSRLAENYNRTKGLQTVTQQKMEAQITSQRLIILTLVVVGFCKIV